jgi:hypothetical protein
LIVDLIQESRYFIGHLRLTVLVTGVKGAVGIIFDIKKILKIFRFFISRNFKDFVYFFISKSIIPGSTICQTKSVINNSIDL